MDNNSVLLANSISAFINSATARSRLSQGTLRYYKRYLIRFCEFLGADLPVSKISIILIEKFQTSLNQSGLNPKSCGLCMIAIRRFFVWLHKNDIVSLSVDLIEIPRAENKILEVPTIEDIDKLIKACNIKSKIGLRDRAIVETLLSSGLRVTELTKIELKNLNLAYNRTIVCGKRNKMRLILFSEQAGYWIKKYLEARNKKSFFLFPVTARQIERRLEYLSKKAEVKIHPHLLRHYFATEGLNRGLHIYKVSRLLGHSSIQSTQKYLNITDSDLEDSYREVWNISRHLAKIP